MGRIIRDLFRLLCDVQHDTEALVYSNYPRETAVSTSLAIIFERIASGVPNAAPASVMLAVVALNNR